MHGGLLLSRCLFEHHVTFVTLTPHPLTPSPPHSPPPPQAKTKSTKGGGYSAKSFVLCSQADATKEWVPQDESSRLRYVLIDRSRTGRMVVVPTHGDAVCVYGSAGVVLIEKALNKLPLIEQLRGSDYLLSSTTSSVLMTLRELVSSPSYCLATLVLMEQAAPSAPPPYSPLQCARAHARAHLTCDQ